MRKNTPQECYMNYHQFSMFTNMKTSKGSIEIKHLKEFKYKIQEISSLFDVEQNAFNLNKGDRRFVIIDLSLIHI